jgi:hypothetical protein
MKLIFQQSKMKNLYLIAILCICLLGCDQFDDRLTILNKSSQTIFYELSQTGVIKKYPIVMDSNNRDTLWNRTPYVKPGDSSSIVLNDNWEKYIYHEYKDSVMTIYIFDEHLLKKISPDSLISNQIYTKKYRYKVDDLKKLNWHIEFKGNNISS